MDLTLHKMIYKPDRYSLKADEVLKELDIMAELVNLHE